MVESNLDISPDYAREKLEYLSLEEESDTDEMGDDTIQEDMIDFKVEDESETRSMLPHAPPPQSQDFKIISKPNETNNLSPETDLHNAIPRAKNIIAFLRALYNEQYFRNIDPNYFVVISDGQLIGIYENEEIARQVAAQTNITVGNQAGDGMVFPISGNFKPKRNSAGRTFDFPT